MTAHRLGPLTPKTRETIPALRSYEETSTKTPRNILRRPPKLPPMPNIKGDR